MWVYLSVLGPLSGPTGLTAAVSDVGIPDRSAKNVVLLVCIEAPVWPDRTNGRCDVGSPAPSARNVGLFVIDQATAQRPYRSQ
jgi:hypothetical protein